MGSLMGYWLRGQTWAYLRGELLEHLTVFLMGYKWGILWVL